MASSLEAYKLREVEVTDRELGSGCFATVFELNFKGLKCAGKKINDRDLSNDETYRTERFEKECRLLSQVRHPNIVQFLGVYSQEDAKAPLLVMEFLPMTLTFCIEQYSGELSNCISYSILHDIALGLNYLHSQTKPIIHKDLSSNNILLAYNLTAKISDLGISEILNLSPLQRSRTKNKFGTLAFMPPEMINVANPVSAVTIDQFSYGIIMIHLLSTECPEPELPYLFPNEDGELIGYTEAKRRERFLAMIGEDHPLMDLIKRCISNIPKKRAHASDIVQQLEELLADESRDTRLEMLQQIEAGENVLKQGKLEEEQYTKKREMIEEDIQKCNDKQNEYQCINPALTENLRQKREMLRQQNEQLSDDRRRLVEKQRRQDDLLMKSKKKLEQIHQCLYGESALSDVQVRQEKGKRKRSTTAPETQLPHIKERKLSDGNSDAAEGTSTLKRMRSRLKEMVTKQRVSYSSILI